MFWVLLTAIFLEIFGFACWFVWILHCRARDANRSFLYIGDQKVAEITEWSFTPDEELE